MVDSAKSQRVSKFHMQMRGGGRNDLEPGPSRSGRDIPFGVKEDELLARGRLHPDQELLVLAQNWFCASIRDEEDAVRLFDSASASPNLPATLDRRRT